ncbi:MAG: hypothetical protein AAFR55_00135 [Pseudomonadota bacterium]
MLALVVASCAQSPELTNIVTPINAAITAPSTGVAAYSARPTQGGPQNGGNLLTNAVGALGGVQIPKNPATGGFKYCLTPQDHARWAARHAEFKAASVEEIIQRY